MSKAGYASLETEAKEGDPETADVKEDDIESGEEDAAAVQPQKPFCSRTLLCGGAVLLAATCCLALVILVFHHPSMDIKGPSVEKRGAGLFLVSGGEVLLLLRRSKHNDNMWGLPGGNVDDSDTDLLATARREGAEEMGSVPACNVTGEVLTKRGRKDQKHYTVFVCTVDAAAREAFQPALNEEHREARWWPLDALPPLPKLHPVVATLVQDPGAREQVGAALPGGLRIASNATLASSAAAFPSAAAANASADALAPGERIEKQGAGMLLADGSKVLLLRKKGGGKHAPGKWAMPGGSADSKDADALATAEREALEEVGGIPSHEVKGRVVLKRRGKKGVKLFTVILVAVDQPGASATFAPELEDDHHEVAWVELAEAAALPAEQLQPHLAELLSGEHSAELQAAFGVPL